MNTNSKLFILFIHVFIFMMSDIFAFSNRALKSDIPKYRIDRKEPDVKFQSSSRESCSVVYPMNMDNNTWFTLVDSSANGYGMVSSVTHPIDVNEEGKWLLAYRQYVGSNDTHGQIGAAYSINGENWQTQFTSGPPTRCGQRRGL